LARLRVQELGDLRAAEVAAETQGDELALAVAERGQRTLEVGLEAEIGRLWRRLERAMRGVDVVERLVCARCDRPGSDR
jgi:hypothetical protein